MIELKNVTKIYHKKVLLSEINLNIPQSSITVIEGINGSGKTLLLKSILGLIRVQGDILINEEKVNPERPYPVKAGILIENPSLIEDFTARKNLELLAKLDPEIEEEQIEDLLNYFEINRFPKQKVKKFSLGMKQKLGIAQALLGQSPLVVLDEPTNALDYESIQNLIKIIKKYQTENGTTFLIASHDKEFIEKVATKRVYISEGKVIEKE